MPKPKTKKPAKSTTKRGRPTVYSAVLAQQAYSFCLLGADDARLAELFEVNESTITRWKQRHPEFRLLIASGKSVADAAVAAALFRSATGGHVIEEDRVISDGDSGQKVVTLAKQLPPDVQAQTFWLKNREPQKWRDRVEIQEDITLNKVDMAELAQIFGEKMRLSHARQAAILQERGIEYEGD